MKAAKANDTSDIKAYVSSIASSAKQAAAQLLQASTKQKNEGLLRSADLIDKERKQILAANSKDMKRAQENDLDPALLDRLELNSERVDGMIESLQKVASLDDPVGEISGMRYVPSGIRVGQMRVPLGVVGIIYESRPNVTSEAASLCLKSGNACILRGGSEAIDSNLSIAALIQEGLKQASLPAAAVIQVESTDRAVVGEMIGTKEYLDVLIPRGGKGLIKRIDKESRVNIIKHLDGNCHVYLDKNCDKDMGVTIAVNAKTRRYGVCNAMESLLVHKSRAEELLPLVAKELGKHKVELRGCDATCKIISEAKKATEEDWYTEYLAPILSIKVVNDLDEAISHINKYGSHHTDAIITKDKVTGERFVNQVDSSSVMWNASTSFADGFEYGLGAEVGISTDKFHARGPVGLTGLTTQKFVVIGEGQTRG